MRYRQGRIHAGATGAITPTPLQEGQKNIFNVSEINPILLILLHFGIHENAFDTTQNALISQLLIIFIQQINENR